MRMPMEVVDVSRRREVMLAPPPFIDDRKLWGVAVEQLRQNRERFPGEPFLVAARLYRQLGGDFR